MYLIENFRTLNQPEKIIITQHGRKRLNERGISIDDVFSTIDNGEIIEHYPDDYPFPSCLILGQKDDKIIHIVASINEDMIYIITAYIPDQAKWEGDFKTRKEI
ncbi:MAG: DUF4258 domain-containing protein [Synergistaceae bacterium]|nr:DUF4258 domain-containing protein [Synergistaceae bacterium]